MIEKRAFASGQGREMDEGILSKLTVAERERLFKLARAFSLKSNTTELPPITRAERAGRLPLSFAQQRLWFLAQMEGMSEAYHVRVGLRLSGKLERQALRRALDRIVERHEVLRTTFALMDGEAVQQIRPAEASRFVLIEQDLSGHAAGRSELQRWSEEEARTPFDLEAGPLIRGRLMQLGEEEHALLITMHHIVSDGWSMGVMIRELSGLYAAYVREEEDALPELSVQYADYAVWQRQWIEGRIMQEQAEYWKTALAGAPELLELPADRGRPAEQDYAGAYAGLVVEEKVTAGLKELSRRQGTTLYMTMVAAWAALLARLSGQTDVVMGTPVANRGRVEIEGLIGFFVNTLALRVDVSGAPTVAELLGRVKAHVIAAQQHQDIPFEQVVENAQPVRSLSHSPLFQVMFAWQNTPRENLELPGLEVRPLRSGGHTTSKFDLTLTLGEAGERIIGGVEYATSLFEAATIERYLGQFRTLLEAMTRDDAQVVDRLPLLTEEERRQVVYGWNQTEVEFPGNTCVHELIEQQVERAPKATAVVFEEASLSYGELNRQANRLAHYLRRLGVGPDARVAIGMERSLEMVVAVLAVLKAGGAYVPLDPSYPAERLAYMLEDSGPVAVLTQGALKGQFTRSGDTRPVIDVMADAERWAGEAETNPERESVGLTSRHLAYVIYTSGSTGAPKGVMNEHRAVVNLLMWMQGAHGLEADGALLQKTPISFDASVTELFWPLLTGARLVMARPEGHKDPAYLWDVIERGGITTLQLVPTMLQALLEQAEGKKTTSLKCVQCGGEALSGKLARGFRQRVAGAELHNLYGPTEAAVDVTAWTCREGSSEEANVPIGRPIANTRIYILDGNGEPAPVGVWGELYVGGVQVARGYLNRPELTTERFMRDRFASEAEARMYRTGDQGRWRADGTIEFLGRNDFQVKVRGYRIELGEIEARLTEHGGIRDAVVMAREDKPGDQRLVAYYTCAEGDEVGAEELRAHVAGKLPGYMAPAAYVRLEALPLTPNGKLDRKALPAPDGDAYAVQGYEAPVGEIERQMAEVWAEVLGVEEVGRHDNFFALGGHSLLAVKLIERLRQKQLTIDVWALFATPTVAGLAAAVKPHIEIIDVPPNQIPNVEKKVRSAKRFEVRI